MSFFSGLLLHSRQMKLQNITPLLDLPSVSRQSVFTGVLALVFLISPIFAQPVNLVLNGEFAQTNGAGGIGQFTIQCTRRSRIGRRAATTSYSLPELRIPRVRMEQVPTATAMYSSGAQTTVQPTACLQVALTAGTLSALMVLSKLERSRRWLTMLSPARSMNSASGGREHRSTRITERPRNNGR